jgi:hypothetical protein
MKTLVDTGVWSLALRRSPPASQSEVGWLATLLQTGDQVATTGIVFQEILQGTRGPRYRERIVQSFRSLPFLIPDRQDHDQAAQLHVACRRKGLQVGTIDVLLAQLCMRYHLDLLTTDQDFEAMQKICSLRLFQGPG